MLPKNNNSQFENLYEVTKTVRFELKPSQKNNFTDGDIDKLLEDFKSTQKQFLEIFVLNCELQEVEENGKKIGKYINLKFREKREIKYSWLRSYTKNQFYAWDKKSDEEKKYLLTSIDFLEEEVLRWLNEWQILTNDLEENTQTAEHKQKRKSEIAFILRGFLKRQNFQFIKDFFNSTVDIQGKKGNEADEQINSFREQMVKIEQNFNSCLKEYLPAQSNGVLLHKASLNYYTLNKTPKEYQELKVAKESEKNSRLSSRIFKRSKFNKKLDRKEILFNCDSDWLKKIKLGTDIYNWTLDEAYTKLKIWKANQKSQFTEKVQQGKITLNNFKDEFPLFDTTVDNFKTFEDLTKKLDKPESEDPKKIAKDRGKFFNDPNNKHDRNRIILTENYYELCELYKRIAQKRGKIIAEIKGIENEEVQSQNLTHWALMAEENGLKKLVLIPRKKDNELENHKNAHKKLDQIKEEQKQKNINSGEITVYHFKSLTLRALEKLCFKEVENTFAPEIEKEGVIIPKFKQQGIKDPDYQNKMVNFYIDVLNSDYAKKYLDLVDFGNLEKFLEDLKNTDDLEKFELGLEKVCYTKVAVYFSTDEFSQFKKDFAAQDFEINTRSLSKDSGRKENAHAKIWTDFWTQKNNYTTRLNPELQIFYRDAIPKKDNSNRLNAETKVNNRFSAPRYTLATTISLNASGKKTNLAFKTIDEIKKHIDKFNEDFNTELKKSDDVWCYGIDRGLKELATLCIVKFSNEKNKFDISKPQEFAEIPVYKLKDEKADLKDENGNILKNAKGENRKIIDNISEVLKEGVEPDTILFKKVVVSSIDLTQAKLIRGHIILNGDQKTYLKLKELSAKRRIFELLSTAKIDTGSEISGSSNLLIGGCKIYFLNEWQTQDGWKSQREALKIELKDYLHNLDLTNKESDIETIEKINHLRDAITANMVGIIYHLQNTLGMKGVIGLENLDTINKHTNKKMIDEHFDQSNQDISRRLEWSLYRKFATTGEVPPQIKESILLRDEFEVYQIGILDFVKIEGTSSNCPNCNNNLGKSGNHFKCNKFGDKNPCDFDSSQSRTILEQNLNNSDEVAAYNIAKNAFNKIYNEK